MSALEWTGTVHRYTSPHISNFTIVTLRWVWDGKHFRRRCSQSEVYRAVVLICIHHDSSVSKWLPFRRWTLPFPCSWEQTRHFLFLHAWHLLALRGHLNPSNLSRVSSSFELNENRIMQIRTELTVTGLHWCLRHQWQSVVRDHVRHTQNVSEFAA